MDAELTKWKKRAEKAEAELAGMRAENALRPELRRAGVAEALVPYAINAIRAEAKKIEIDESGKLVIEWDGVPYTNPANLAKNFLRGPGAFFTRDIAAEQRASGTTPKPNFAEMSAVELATLGLERIPGLATPPGGGSTFGSKPESDSPAEMMRRGLDKAGV